MGRTQLASERQKRGKTWTQNHVASKLGITKAAYSNIENGRRKPSYDVLCKLETLFGKPHSYLLADSEAERRGA
jgi:transcriptional regulator with XRE-family HTH domain